MNTSKVIEGKLLIGWTEWCELPGLNIPIIKAKIDTGAKTSAIHALNIKRILNEGTPYARFDLKPIQGNNKILIHCEAPIIDERYITSSNGHKEKRYIINTPLKISNECWNIELSLSNREPLKYRMLLGREAMNHRVLVHPGITCNQGKITKEALVNAYRT